MRSRRQPTQDSLELLLDTLCNVFGGIILITCLLALMNNKKSEGPKKSSLDAGRGQLIEQRLVAATEELKRIKELHAKMQASDDADTRLLAAEHMELQKTLERLRQEKVESSASTGAPVTDPAQEVLSLKSKVEEAQAKLAEASSEESALKAKATEITARIEEVKKKIGDKEKTQTRKLRFPKERTQSKRPLFLVVKDGKIYPIFLPTGQLFPGVEKHQISDHQYSVSLKPENGWSIAADKSKVSSFLSQLEKDSQYISVLIDDNDASFGSFTSLKELIISQGLNYGIQVLEAKKPIVFTTKGGTSAPPL